MLRCGVLVASLLIGSPNGAMGVRPSKVEEHNLEERPIKPHKVELEEEEAKPKGASVIEEKTEKKEKMQAVSVAAEIAQSLEAAAWEADRLAEKVKANAAPKAEKAPEATAAKVARRLNALLSARVQKGGEGLGKQDALSEKKEKSGGEKKVEEKAAAEGKQKSNTKEEDKQSDAEVQEERSATEADIEADTEAAMETWANKLESTVGKEEYTAAAKKAAAGGKKTSNTKEEDTQPGAAMAEGDKLAADKLEWTSAAKKIEAEWAKEENLETKVGKEEYTAAAKKAKAEEEDGADESSSGTEDDEADATTKCKKECAKIQKPWRCSVKNCLGCPECAPIEAPTPAPAAAPASGDMNFDWMDENSFGGGPAQPAQPSMQVSAPQAFQQQSFQQQGFPQPGFQQQGFQQPGFAQPQGFPQQPQAFAQQPQQPHQPQQPQQQQPQAFVQPPQPQAFAQQPQQPQQQQPVAFAQPSAFPQQAQPQQQPQQQQQQPGQGGVQMPPDMSNLVAGGMAAAGLNPLLSGIVQNQLESQINAHGKGVLAYFPALFMGLQQLFCVGHSFVLRKLLLLLCPFIKKSDQGAPTNAWGGEASPGAQPATLSPDGLKIDVEEADLYIPAMAYVTYVLLYGVHRGMLKEFNPEVLSKTFSFALVMALLEVGTFYMAFYFAGNPMPALPLAANIGYKYVPCVLCVVARILTAGHSIYWLFFAYFAACAAWSIRRFMMRMETPVRAQYGCPPSPLTTHIITVMAGVQVPMCFILLRGA